MKIIAVDDHPIITDSYVKFLKESGLEDTIYFNDPESCMDYCENNRDIDLFIIDYGLPYSEKYKISNGCDLIVKLKVIVPNAKFIVITLIDVGVDVYLLLKKARPNGIWYKGEVSFFNLIDDIKKIMQGYYINSPVVQEKINAIEKYDDTIDKYDLEIISSICKGIPNKELENLIPLSMSNINRRKSDLKILFDVENLGNVEFIKKLRTLNII